MSGNIKINPQIAQGTEGVFGNQAVELQGLISKINSEVTANVGSGKPGWEGAQADAFVSAWENEFKTALNKLVMALNDAKSLLNKTIAAYQQLDS